MDSLARRTSSSSSLHEELSGTRARSRSQTFSGVHFDIVTPAKPTRFRRSSFALSGERQTPLDELVDSASRDVNTAAAAHQAATLSVISSPPPEPVTFLSDEDGLDSKRMSVSTIVSSRTDSPTVFHLDPKDQPDRASTICPSTRKVTIPTDESFVWHNAQAFPMNPLTSELIQNYLAALAVEKQSGESDLQPGSPPRHSPTLCENVPGLFVPGVASMTMPVQQILRAHSSSTALSRPSTRMGGQSDSKLVHPARHDTLHAFTDYLATSSCASDVEYWPSRARGYVSDNPIDEADPRAKQLRLAGQRFEADLHRVSRSVPRSPETRRKFHVSGVAVSEAGAGVGTPPVSKKGSSFELQHIYDGLPSPKTSASTASLNNLESFRPTITPPSTPDSSRSVSSVGRDSGSSGGGGLGRRFFSLFGQAKQKPSDKDDSGKYIYMDEKTCERRANARASNIISPVSF